MDTLGVAFVGDFEVTPPTDAMIMVALEFFEDAKLLGKLSEAYVINAAVDFVIMADSTSLGPGEAFMKIIRSWERYSRKKI